MVRPHERSDRVSDATHCRRPCHPIRRDRRQTREKGKGFCRGVPPRRCLHQIDKLPQGRSPFTHRITSRRVLDASGRVYYLSEGREVRLSLLPSSQVARLFCVTLPRLAAALPPLAALYAAREVANHASDRRTAQPGRRQREPLASRQREARADALPRGAPALGTATHRAQGTHPPLPTRFSRRSVTGGLLPQHKATHPPLPPCAYPQVARWVGDWRPPPPRGWHRPSPLSRLGLTS